MRPSIAVAVLALGGLQLWYVRAGDTACHAFDADTRSIEWSLVRNKEQQVSCLYQLANERQKDDLKKWLEAEGFVVCPVYDREKLKSGNRIKGPAIVEQMDATTVLLPGMHGYVEPYLNLILEMGQ
mgnify:CR=1 FL=1